MKARKIISLLAIIAVAFIGCDKNEMIKAQIKKNKAKIAKLKEKNEELEKELTDTINEKQSIPVNIKQMTGEEFRHYIVVFGEVEAEKYAMISPEMGGLVKKIYVDEGDYVEKGKLLVSLNTDAISNTIKQLKASYDLALETYEKQKTLWENKIGSEIQYKQAKTAKESLEAQIKATEAQKNSAEIRAPFDGYVNDIFKKIGELASPGMPVVEIVNLRRLYITADVSEDHIGKIKEGQKVEVTFANYPEMKIKTPIVRVSKMINEKNRTFEIEMKLRNSNEKIKPNQISKITINDFSSIDAYVLPSIIIKQDITGKYVFTARERDGKVFAEKTYIKTGLSYDDKTMVTSGLSENQKVITDGYNLVSKGVPVEINNKI